MSGQAGRYQRSVSGLVGAMLVSLVAIAGFVGFRALNRDDLDVRPEPIDLAEAVQAGAAAGARPVYPEPMPRGWTATSVDTGTLDDPAWGLGLHTADGRFVGIRREDAPLEQLLDTYVDQSPTRGRSVDIDSAVGDRWQTWTDDGGDTAYAAEVGDAWLLVYGSAPAGELRSLIGVLTDEVSSAAP